jgi:hypothetical protein
VQDAEQQHALYACLGHSPHNAAVVGQQWWSVHGLRGPHCKLGVEGEANGRDLAPLPPRAGPGAERRPAAVVLVVVVTTLSGRSGGCVPGGGWFWQFSHLHA